MSVNIRIPADEELIGYDMESLLKNVEQHHKNIAAFQQAIEDEQTRLSLTESMIKRKRELERGNSGIRQKQ